MIRNYILFVLLLIISLGGLAQATDQLPISPAYKGEIRRGADGRLIVLDAVEPAKAGADSAPKSATMVVGSQEKITTVTEAAKRARDGEIIEIRPGDYRGQPAVWTQNNLIIRGVGSRPVMVADGRTAEGKAIWVVRGGNVRIENIEFRGARVASKNGAGIRFERGQLVVQHSAFFDSEMGILTANFPELGDLLPGDLVFAEDGCLCGVTGASPVLLDRQCFEIEFEGDHRESIGH